MDIGSGDESYTDNDDDLYYEHDDISSAASSNDNNSSRDSSVSRQGNSYRASSVDRHRETFDNNASAELPANDEDAILASSSNEALSNKNKESNSNEETQIENKPQHGSVIQNIQLRNGTFLCSTFNISIKLMQLISS